MRRRDWVCGPPPILSSRPRSVAGDFQVDRETKIPELGGISCLQRLDSLTTKRDWHRFPRPIVSDSQIHFMNHDDEIVRSELGSISAVDYLTAIALTIVAVTLRFLFIEQPIRFDEALSYYLFYGDSLFQATHNYSTTNNHVLHSILCFFSIKMFGVHLWSIRLPAFIFGAACVPVAYFIGARFFQRLTGIVFALCIACNSFLVEFSTNARGYSLLCLCSMLYVLLLPGFLRRNMLEGILFAGVTVIGAYTIAVMLFPTGGFLIAVFSIWLLHGERQQWRANLKYLTAIGVAISLALLILYSPIIRHWRIRGLTSNATVAAQPSYSAFYQGLVWDCREFFNAIFRRTNWANSLFLGVMTVWGTANLYRSNRRLLILIVSNVGFLLVFSLFKKIFPPGRAMIYLVSLLVLISSLGMVSALGLLKVFHSRIALLAYSGFIVFDLVTSEHILQSRETGTFPHQAGIIEMLKKDEAGFDGVLAATPSDFPLLFSTRNIAIGDKVFSANYHYDLWVNQLRRDFPPQQVLYVVEDRSALQDKARILEGFGITSDPDSSTEYRIAPELSLWKVRINRASDDQ